MEIAREMEERRGEKEKENEKRICGVKRSAKGNIHVKGCEIDHVLICGAI